MIQDTKTGTTGAGFPEDKSSKFTSSIFVWMFLSVVWIGFCEPANGPKSVSLSPAAAIVVLESMPLWGGAAALSRLSAGTGFEKTIPLHHFDQLACGSCHEVLAATGNFETPDKIDWKSAVAVNRSCTFSGCHEYEPKMNHPVGVSVPAGLAGQMPLGPASEITCLTCHDSVAPAGLDSSENTQDRYLVWPDPEICQSCHERSSGSLKDRAHWKFSQKAHLIPLSAPSGMKTEGDGWMDSEIDAESQICLSCHDEVSATIPGINGTKHRASNGFSSTSDHPIGMDYQSVAADNSVYFNALGPHQKNIRMFDGKVGCGSCHTLYNPGRFHLVVENDKSALCRQCHNR